MATFQFQIFTAQRQVLNTEIESVILPTTEGEIGIYRNHAPLVTALAIGVVQYGPKQERKQRAAVTGGFAEMNNNVLTVYASAAELAEEIDIMRAKQAQERAERHLAQKHEDLDFNRAQVALQRALTRIKAAQD